MDRKANLPPTTAPTNPARPVAADSNLTSTSTTTSSSSSSSASFSPPEFLRQAHAVFKRHRPLGTMQSKVCRATRVLVSQADPSKSNSSLPALTLNQIGKSERPPGAAVQTSNAVLDETKDLIREVMMRPPEDSSITPPSITGTVTIGDEKMVVLADREQQAMAASSCQVASSHVLGHDGSRKENLTFQKEEDHPEMQVAIDGPHLKQQDLGNMEQSGTGLKLGASLLENRKDLSYNQFHVEPMTHYSAMSSSCATSLSVYSGPTSQCTHAVPGGQSAFATQMSSISRENPNVQGFALPEDPGAARHQDHQHGLHGDDNTKKESHDRANCLQSAVPSMNNSSSTRDLGPSQQSKTEKAPRKKKYDPDVFFKVNGKLYQKLGKIGSGGSSEVHKVISSDCTIYALKKIKLKGRDYPTAYGFCQEMEYLNKLKGKSNIIQLVDYEVTDKTLLQEVVYGSMTMKDKRIKGDECIYMVLEYGEIDLAHMLSHKWKEISSSSCRIDENWLRFYWQQMLEAVNTIHEERIVHSDLKPANFLLVRGSLKLIDFGIAKAIMSDTTNIQRDAQVGTLNYMSPEAFMCNEDDANGNTIKCGRPSDIWSLGCILYQMVYGKTPFSEYKTFWSKFKVVTDKTHEIVYEPVSNPWLIDLMKRCLSWDRNDRWRIPQLLQHPFLVPPIPRELPPFPKLHPCKSLLERAEAYWTDPQVSRLCLQLHEVLTDLETEPKDPPSSAKPSLL